MKKKELRNAMNDITVQYLKKADQLKKLWEDLDILKNANYNMAHEMEGLKKRVSEQNRVSLTEDEREKMRRTKMEHTKPQLYK